MDSSPASGSSSGLAENSVGFFQVFAQGLVANGPLASTTVAMTAAAAYALGALPLAYLLGIVVVALWVNTPFQFSQRLASASGVAYFVAKGAGSLWGYLAGLSYAAYYMALIPANAIFFGILVSSLLPVVGIYHPASWLWIPLSFLLIVPSTLLTYLGIKTSLNYAVFVACLEIAILICISLVIVLSPHTNNTLAVYNPHLAAGGLGGFAIGLLVAAFGMSGSTATVYLGRESRAPQRTIQKALIWSTVLVVAMFVLVSYAFTVGWGYRRMGNFASTSIPGLIVVQRYLGRGPELLFALFVINSLVGVNMAASIVVSRLLMTMGQAQLLPAGLGKTHARYLTPHVSVVWTGVMAVLLGLITAMIWGPGTGYIVLILLATMGEFLGHILGNMALPLYAWRRGRLRWIAHVLLPILSLASIVLGIFYTFFPVSVPFIYPALFSIAILIAAAIQFHMTTRSPVRTTIIDHAFARLGTDES
ncbi:MAG: APC family permease [Firmicutes bacterium]|nr:APC family permease [Bacillota bacterium]